MELCALLRLALGAAAPMIVILLVLALVVQRLKFRRASLGPKRTSRRWLDLLMPVRIIGIVALVSSLARLVSRDHAPGVVVVGIVGVVLGVGGLIAEVVLWFRLRRESRGI